ncbi:MAG: hypothetical protein V4675_24515 [Verrucomicrobiota bacterium]
MELAHAIAEFDNWSLPWTFDESVRHAIRSNPAAQREFEALSAEAGSPDHWLEADLAFACKIAHTVTKEKYPETDDSVIAAIVRAASYSWR